MQVFDCLQRGTTIKESFTSTRRGVHVQIKAANADPDSFFLREKEVKTNFRSAWVQKSGADNAASIKDLSSWPCFIVSAFLFGA